jgi:hypothetical protein
VSDAHVEIDHLSLARAGGPLSTSSIPTGSLPAGTVDHQEIGMTAAGVDDDQPCRDAGKTCRTATWHINRAFEIYFRTALNGCAETVVLYW